MSDLNHIAGGLPGRTDEQREACRREIEALARSLIKRGAYRGIVAAAMSETAMHLADEEAERAGFRPGMLYKPS